ncbi:MAG: 3-hydroxyacyl-CoA dehydrogenase family protein [Actinomycetia bacterium]|nr:3-hydroxyacyl-CoA dehydrogenase family protein [Actinomycetes bacterium]
MAEISKIAIIGSGAGSSELAALAREKGISVVDLQPGADLSALPGCQVIVEASSGDLTSRAAILADASATADPDAVLVTTDPTLSTTDLALATGVPQRVVGLALALPADAQSLAEVAVTPLAASAAVATVTDLCEQLDRTTMQLNDRAGLVTTRLLFGYLNHAVGMVEAGYASKQDVDAAMRFGCGYPVGPIAMLDAIGLDVVADGLANLYDTTGERVHAPAPILNQLIAAGRLGQKSGAGFYTYDGAGSSQVVAAPEDTVVAGTPAAPRAVQSVGVIGSGTMATGIIEVFAKSGFDVTFVARSEEKVARVAAALAKSLDKQVSKGRLAEAERDQIVARTNGVTSVAGLDQVDLALEAVVEDLEIKLELFRELDRVCKPGAVLATTTSSLPVVEMAAVTDRPQDVVGLHFFNPAPIMKLVEIVSTVATAPDVLATAQDVCARTKKVAVECGDRGGFIVNALLFPYLNDAVRMLEANYASKEEIDQAIKAAVGFPMGPFQLLDVVGNDVSLAIQEVLLAEFRDPGFTPAKTLQDVVQAGFLGRKTGRGFYEYS